MKTLWSSASYKKKLLFIISAGLLFRTLWALSVPVQPLSDSFIYASSAENIVLHNVYGVKPDKPFSYWPVGTAAIYALGYKMFGISSVTVVFLNLVASLALIYTSSLLAHRWFDEKIAVITSGILACWPSLIMYVTIFASEVFFTLFVNLALLAWQLDSRRWIFRAITTGLMIAIASYVRPVALLLPFVIICIEFIHNKQIVRPIIGNISKNYGSKRWDAMDSAMAGQPFGSIRY